MSLTFISIDLDLILLYVLNTKPMAHCEVSIYVHFSTSVFVFVTETKSL